MLDFMVRRSLTIGISNVKRSKSYGHTTKFLNTGLIMNNPHGKTHPSMGLLKSVSLHWSDRKIIPTKVTKE
jgi:hypothetical protein